MHYNARSLPRLGAAVKGLRRARGMTQAEAAAAAGVSRQWVIALEAGKTSGLEIGLLMRLLDALNASLLVRDDLEGERG
ncbi:helix-turn-helix domain-containing protein [Xylanimonas sp. McL0601]|uniref:helix-turn-helix domain-containing protein n=1 Tax=Xylanimonas sp. McL0601 TaxID=3414739 RepID=UPI003CF333B1